MAEQSLNIEAIWSEYRASLKAFLYSRVSDKDQADDLLQEVLVKTYDKLDTLNDASSVKAWLFQVANNAITDFYRRQAKANGLSAEDLWYQQDEPGIHQQLSQCVAPFISALPEEQSSLLTAVDLEGVSQKQFAEDHDIPYTTLKSRVKKARGELRHLFDQCCRFELDASGNLVSFDRKSGPCKNC